MHTPFFSSRRQSAVVASRRQDGARIPDPKPVSPATAPQPIDAELLKFVGGAGRGDAPVNRW